MDVLREVFSGLGFDNVETFIASGNVIFDTRRRAGLAAAIEEELEQALGFDVPVFLRTGSEVVAVTECRPFADVSDQAEISFLPAEPSSGAVESLLATVAGNDRLAVVGREVYWYHPGRRDESPHKESTVMRLLGMPTTQRSARTVLRIAEKFLR
jgi:uncharacterized protein (DUF1697 family)